MNTPGKDAYKRKTVKESSRPTYNRKKTSMSGSDARTAYKRKQQGASSVAKSLRKRLKEGV